MVHKTNKHSKQNAIKIFTNELLGYCTAVVEIKSLSFDCKNSRSINRKAKTRSSKQTIVKPVKTCARIRISII